MRRTPPVSMLPISAALSPRGRAAVLALSGLVLVAFLAHVAYTLLGLAENAVLKSVIGDWTYNGVQIGCAVLCLTAAAVRHGARAPWFVLGGGMLLWAAGDVYWTVALSDLEEPPYPSLADALWIAFYPAAYVSLCLIARRQIERLPVAAWLDGLIGSLAVAAFGSALLVVPLVAATDGTTSVVITNLAYPLGDLLLLGIVVGMYAITGWRPGRTWLLLGAGLAVSAVADGIYLFHSAAMTYAEGTPLDNLWPAGLLLMTLAAWQHDRPAGTLRLQSWGVLVFPSLFTLVALGLLVYGNLASVHPLATALASAALLAVVARTALTFRDVRTLAESRREATTDDLTGLANRRLFNQVLEHALRDARRHGSPLALIVADLDGFKELNDTMGHHAGDLLLKEIASGLTRSIPSGHTLARLGGDEFALLCPGTDPGRARETAQLMREAVNRAFPVQGVTVHVDTSLGVALFPLHGEDGATLLQRADVAMYQAKERRSGVELYTSERDQNSRRRLNLLGELPRGIAARELVLHYQPKVDLASDRVVGVEALVRWQHPRLGLVPPGDFLPMAERTALMRPLTLEVIELALTQSRRWTDEGLHLPVAVNLAVPNLLDERLPEALERLLVATGVDSRALVLEITETTIMADPTRADRVLSGLAALGVGLSLDDFGAGHSSLAHLRWLPVKELKIDRAFMADLCEDSVNTAIVRSTIELGNRLGLRVVGEGVETLQTLERLGELGCDVAQGYFISPPVAARDLAAWLDTHAARGAPLAAPL